MKLVSYRILIRKGEAACGFGRKGGDRVVS